MLTATAQGMPREAVLRATAARRETLLEYQEVPTR